MTEKLICQTSAQFQREVISRFFIIYKSQKELKLQKYLFRRMAQQAKISTDSNSSKAIIKRVTMVTLSLPKK